MGKLYLGTEAVNFAVNEKPVDNDTNIMLGVTGNTLCRTNKKFKLPEGVTRLSASALAYAFYNSPSIEEADLSQLVEVPGGSALQYAFGSCANLKKLDLSNLKTVTGANALSSLLYGANGVTEIRFDSLETITGSSCLAYAFRAVPTLTDVYFPALTPDSFGTSVNQFTDCVRNNTGVTLHFPASVRVNIERMTGYPNFGGTNTVILFDL